MKEKAMNKADLVAEISGSTGISRKQVSDVFDALPAIVQRELGKQGPGVFNLPDLMKLTRVVRPAKEASTRPSPFKEGEVMHCHAKPERIFVKFRAIKKLKQV